jgi:2,3,4,5-tetrahydropyridine-2,6-dicarboxylate N-acetyltransferase
MANFNITDPYEIARFIKEAKKQTPIKLYVNGDFNGITFNNVKVFGSETSKIIFGDVEAIDHILRTYAHLIKDKVLEYDRRNSAIPMLDISHLEARIEPGAHIREHVVIGKTTIVLMGAVINIGAVIGEGTMIDMNAVVGARAIIGNKCHIGAGAVVAGVLEPPSKTPVIIEDDVLVGANAVILEGVRIGKGAVVAAGAVVISDVAPETVVAGSPAKFIKNKDEKTKAKTEILADLRK